MKILVGYNELKVDEKVLAQALKHANVFKADIIIMTSLEQGPKLQKDDIEAVEDRLEKLKRPFDKDHINCETTVSVNYLSPGEDLVKFAKENGVDQIFLGIKKTSKVGKLMFGSTAQYVLLNAPCPVVAVR